MPRHFWRRIASAAALSILAASVAGARTGTSGTPHGLEARQTVPPPTHGVIPAPSSVELSPGNTFAVTPATAVVFDSSDERVAGLPGSVEAAWISARVGAGRAAGRRPASSRHDPPGNARFERGARRRGLRADDRRRRSQNRRPPPGRPFLRRADAASVAALVHRVPCGAPAAHQRAVRDDCRPPAVCRGAARCWMWRDTSSVSTT